ncbi:NAD-dependent protein deacetylase [Rubripirellula tenax]|uniref:NAD-dependent protein deacetylase n=1 Tax=Rubripirellula tenax TaxID=2528015 RepID=A0A5C6F9X6_9BACT|nr:SIR2 family protein [Rubripirellula tenax]TWU58553.1 NAD-dependent protein deacetylase [Rubripirellula tenax]
MPVEIKPARHLTNAISKTRDHHPNFTLLLGAGASVESGIKSGASLVKDWRQEYAAIHGHPDDAEDYLQSQRWYGQPEEYSMLFEQLFDQPSLRREFIESLIKDANPSWGYVYLVNLIREGVFNTVFTTNFDDLLNEACYLFSTETRPIVCAHDSSIRSIRVFSSRPKIIKLHGDFLFDSIKNTVRELENLEDNMREKFRQCAGEFGMIVIGYGGNDRTIMDTFDALLRNDDYFPHGVYWCVRGDDVPPRVEELSRFSNFHVVKIDGFDSFLATLNGELGFGPPIEDPYIAVRNRLKNLIHALPFPQPWDTTTSVLHDDRVSSRQGASLRGQLMVRGSFGCVRSYRRLISLQDRAIG